MKTHSILTNATDDQLGLAVFENLYDLFRAMANNLPDSQLVEDEKVSRHFTFPTNPMFKGVWQTRLSENEADAVIDEVIPGSRNATHRISSGGQAERYRHMIWMHGSQSAA